MLCLRQDGSPSSAPSYVSNVSSLTYFTTFDNKRGTRFYTFSECNMRGAGVLLCLEYAALAVAAAENGRPRGVAPEFAKFYKDSSAFACISNPSISILFSRVNDDYCDCPDGSDEPGTAACAHLSPLSPQTPANTVKGTVNSSLALPGFYCKNKGHIPSYVPFTNVNDGVCDYDLCCDGSEEFGNVGGVVCPDKCKEIGKEWRKADETRQKSLGTAMRKRKELVLEAQRLRKEVEDAVKDMQSIAQGLEVKVRAAEIELAEVERKEKGKLVRKESAKKGKIGVLTSLAKQRINELKDNLKRVQTQRDSSNGRLQELEALLKTFKEEYNPNFNDEGVKRAVRAWDDYAARDKPADFNTAEDRDVETMLKPDEENGLNWAEFDDDEDEMAVLYQFENYLPPSLRAWLDQKLRDLRVALIDNGIIAASSSSSTESKSVTDARSRLEGIRRDLEDNQNKVKSHKEDLEKDFGADDIFRALKGKCVEKDSGEYTYEVCFLDKTTQKSKKGGSQTNMGNYVRMETITVDDELPANGKGLGSGQRIALKYENGQHCWNGPNRSTLVVLACSEENEVWKIVEEEKCVYRMEVGTPAVCEASSQPQAQSKDEL
ncbi:hypothetical protein AMS68_000925 [Peltaster fructicola]|uniref:Glucosidase 2 subunit beta n=1 Tax=Peltaster fructicola TaxID=286661 RepID=A0A6H0XL97_9PEZI|nr:hypothetical protein AMS68_000925 [Peltaster fructicola]